jgi:hypothetical protein
MGRNYHFDCQTITLITIFAIIKRVNLNLKFIHAIIISRFTRIPDFSYKYAFDTALKFRLEFKRQGSNSRRTLNYSQPFINAHSNLFRMEYFQNDLDISSCFLVIYLRAVSY